MSRASELTVHSGFRWWIGAGRRSTRAENRRALARMALGPETRSLSPIA